MMRRYQISTLAMVILLFSLLYIGYRQLFPFPAADADIDNYSAALLFSENPAALARDPAFNDGTMSDVFWASTYLWMRLLQVLRMTFPEAVTTQMALLQLIPSATAIGTFYYLLRSLELERRFALLFSLPCAAWYVLLFYEGGIPSMYYHALAPLLLGLLWRYILRPSLDAVAVPAWRPLLLGIVIGASPALVNSVNGLAFALLTSLLVGVQWLLGRMHWRTMLLFGGGLAVTLLTFSVGLGAGGAQLALIDEAEAIWVSWMWSPAYNPTVSFGLLTLVLLLGVWAWRKPQRTLQLAWLGASLLFWLPSLGSLSLVLALLWGLRIWTKQADRLDFALIFSLSAAVMIGPPLFYILRAMWAWRDVDALLVIIWEMYRFHMIGFALMAVAAARLAVQMALPIADARLRWTLLCGVAALLSFQTRAWGFDSPALYGLGLLYGLLALLGNRPRLRLSPLMRGLLVTLQGFFVLAGGIGVLSGLKTQTDVSRAFLDAATWVRQNTPQDALFLFPGKADQLFRYTTERSLLYSWMDTKMGIQNPETAEANIALHRDITQSSDMLALAARYGVDYIFTASFTEELVLSPVQLAGTTYTTNLAFSNSYYRVYAVTSASRQG